MADSRYGDIFWHSPDPRAIIPLDRVKPSRSMRKLLQDGVFDIRINTSFESVIRECANRDDTWISEEMIQSYVNLKILNFAHSVETYQDGRMVGGLYGVAIGGAFFGESMFSAVSNASKAAFYFLVHRLLERGFMLLDTQYLNNHTKSLGAIEIPKSKYLKLLSEAVDLPCSFADY